MLELSPLDSLSVGVDDMYRNFKPTGEAVEIRRAYRGYIGVQYCAPQGSTATKPPVLFILLNPSPICPLRMLGSIQGARGILTMALVSQGKEYTSHTAKMSHALKSTGRLASMLADGAPEPISRATLGSKTR